jgi:hypothetical protein
MQLVVFLPGGSGFLAAGPAGATGAGWTGRSRSLGRRRSDQQFADAVLTTLADRVSAGSAVGSSQGKRPAYS